jgi:hypothetical protein
MGVPAQGLELQGDGVKFLTAFVVEVGGIDGGIGGRSGHWFS